MKYVQFYFSYLEPLADLSDEQLGRVTRAILVYGRDKVVPDFKGSEGLAFKFMKSNFDREEASYEEISEKRSAAGKQGGAPRGNKNACKNKQNKQNKQTSHKEEEKEEDEEEESSSNKEEVVFPADAGTTMTGHELKRLLKQCKDGGIKITPFAEGQLREACRKLNPELVEAIITASISNGAHSWAYIQKAVEKASAQGLQSVEEYEVQHQRSKANVVDREAPSGNDHLRARGRRPLKLKQEG